MSWILPIWPKPSGNDRLHRYGFDPGRVRIAYPFRDDVTIGNGVVSIPIRLGLGGPADEADQRVRDAYPTDLPDLGRPDHAEAHARRALVGKERHAALLHNLAQLLARYPDNGRDKLNEAQDICDRAIATEAESAMPFEYPQVLATELRARLSPSYPGKDDAPVRGGRGTD